MKKGIFQKLLPHIIAVLIFLVVAVLFSSPTLSGKVINQSVVVHWKGMAQQSFEYKEKWGHFPLWTNSMFGGMPAFQIAMESQNPVSIGFFHTLFTLGLPKPISFFFLACVMFYFLSQVFRVQPWIGVLGAIAYSYSTYDPVIVSVGHDTKMLAIAYMPALLASLVLLFERKYWLGGALTALFSGLLIGMNHLQITFYFLITAGFMTVMYLIRWIRAGAYKHAALAIGIALLAGGAGALSNATNIFVTYDYSKATMRNGTLNLDTTSASGNKKAGLPIDYAFYYGSYGPTETMTLLIPGIYGGSSSGELDEGSALAKNLAEKGVAEEQAAQFAASVPAYWGPQPGHSGPVYLGAVICLLAIFGFVFLQTPHKWWILVVSVLAILMSWGKNFEGFNAFMFHNLPLYNKFRAPAMILVIPQLLFPLMAIMTLQRLFFGEESAAEKWKKFRQSLFITGGLAAIAVLLYFGFSYEGPSDPQLQAYLKQATGSDTGGAELYSILKEDRQSLFGGDLLRTLFLLAAGAALVFLFIRGKIKYGMAIGGLLVLTAFDLLGVGKRYLNADDFVEPDQYDAAFAPSQADLQILQDTGYYRVLNLTMDVFNDAITSYHHNSVGGYSPVKMSIVEDLLSFQLRKEPMNLNVLNMLNTKYVITPNQQNGQPVAQTNGGALGPVWFVKSLRSEKGWLNVMNALNSLNPKDTAVLESADAAGVKLPAVMDSAATIRLVRNNNDEALYEAASTTGGFAVFSEIFYDRGWKAYIDGTEAPLLRTNYVLRGLQVPAGKHQIRFEFRPPAFYSGERVALIANILILLLLVLAGWQVYRNRRNLNPVP